MSPLRLVLKTQPAWNSITGPLDGYDASKYVAYSMNRRLVGSYTGPLFRVRRSSDNAEMDIPQSGTTVDINSYTAFVGSDVARVTKIYDQGNNSLNAQQTTASYQPYCELQNGVLYMRAEPSESYIKLITDTTISMAWRRHLVSFSRYIDSGNISQALIAAFGGHSSAGHYGFTNYKLNNFQLRINDNVGNYIWATASASPDTTALWRSLSFGITDADDKTIYLKRDNVPLSPNTTNNPGFVPEPTDPNYIYLLDHGAYGKGSALTEVVFYWDEFEALGELLSADMIQFYNQIYMT